MGWIIAIALAGTIAFLFWLFGRLPRASFEPIVAALLLGLAGYALQGQPAASGHPIETVEEAEIDDSATTAGRAGDISRWMMAADGAMNAGLTRNAVEYVRRGLDEDPDNVDLWLALGNALIVHADGTTSPAAEFAFEHAARLSPSHPGPRFFLGLAYTQAGRLDDAERVWIDAIERAPFDSEWRALIEEQLASLNKARQLPER